MKTLRLIARIIIGSVFIFSGFVKGVDLTGSAIKFHDYFQAFHLDFLHFSSLPLAIIFPATEFLIGISLLFALKPKTGAWGVFLFMLFFTPLTLILALFNPVKDCGCFGDALVLTNWQTFLKNLFLLTLAIFLFLQRKHLTGRLEAGSQWALLGFYLLTFTGFSLYSYNHLPLIDFRPYKTGTNIREKTRIPEGAPRDEYKTTLIYEKDGIRKEFTLDNFPWQDSTWKFINQESILVKKGYVPPIHDFSIIQPDGTDITDRILSDPGYTFLLVSPDLSKANKKGLQRAYALSLFAADQGDHFYVITSSGKELMDKLENEGFSFIYGNTDETTCKTIIRSNPGLLLITEGTILGKWHYHDIPQPAHFSSDILSLQLSGMQKKSDTLLSFVLILGLLLFATLAYMILPAAGKNKQDDSTSF